MNPKLSALLKFLVFFGTGIIIMLLVYNNTNKGYIEECRLDGIPKDQIVPLIQKVWNDISSANYFWIFSIIVIFMFSNIFRAMRWMLFVQPMGYKPRLTVSFWSLMLGYFANLGLPRAGEFLRPAAIAKYDDIPVEKVLGTIVTERIIDLICLAIVVLIAITIEFQLIVDFLNQNASIDKYLNLTNGIILLAIASIFTFVFWKYVINSKSENKIIVKIRSLFIGFKDGILSVFKLDRPISFVIYSLLIWICYYLMTYLCFFAFEPVSHLGMKAALIVFTLGTFGIVIPSPGGMGTYHFLLGEGLKIYGISDGDGFSFANIIFFSIQIFGNIFFGILALIMLPRYTSNQNEIRE